MRVRTRLTTVTATAAAALCVLMSVTASAQATTVKGSPQPELKPFTIATHGGYGNLTILPSGILLAAYIAPTTNDQSKVVVCLLPRTRRSCSHTVDILPPGSNDVTGVPQIFSTGGRDVDVLIDYSNAGATLYRSTDSGEVFGAGVNVALDGVAVNEAILLGSNIVFTDSDDRFGSRIESIPTDASGPPATIATPITEETGSTDLGYYKGGLLVGNLGFSDDAIIDFAAEGSNFNATSSYHRVGSFANEDLIAMSGDALLTQSTRGSFPVYLRIFNGTSYGPKFTVPHATTPGPARYFLDRDSSGKIHVFDILANQSYDLEEESTTTGAGWTSIENYGSAITSVGLTGALDSTGSGALLGSYNPTRIYPILAPQSVSFTIGKSTIGKGRSVRAEGSVNAVAAGRAVELQRYEGSGEWRDVARTHEGTGGAFRFTITGSSVGHFDYRAVASDSVGYVQFGYSTVRSLDVVS